MRAEDARLVGQRHQLGEALVHLLRRSLEQAAAAEREHGVAAEQHAVLFEQVRIVTGCMPRNVDDLPDPAADEDRVTFPDSAVASVVLLRFLYRAGDRATIRVG